LTIAACLYLHTGLCFLGQIMGHQAGRAAQEGKRAAQHASVTNGDEFFEAVSVGFFQQGDDIPLSPGRLPFCVLFARGPMTQTLSILQALFTGAERGRWTGFVRLWAGCFLVGGHVCRHRRVVTMWQVGDGLRFGWRERSNVSTLNRLVFALIQ